MATLPAFTAKSIEALKRLIRREQQRPTGTKIPYEDTDVLHAPECYVVKLPAGGISALLPDDPDVPGEEASVDVYQVIDDGSGDPELYDADININNLLHLGGPLSQEYWCLVQRDKFGRWFITYAAKYECVYGEVKGAIAAGDVAFTMDNVVAMQGVSPLDDPTDTTEELEVVHMTGLPAPDNAKATAWFDETNEVWRGIPFYVNVDCEEE